jgi:hypothetical protein
MSVAHVNENEAIDRDRVRVEHGIVGLNLSGVVVARNEAPLRLPLYEP